MEVKIVLGYTFGDEGKGVEGWYLWNGVISYFQKVSIQK